jgi:hypothetical protein
MYRSPYPTSYICIYVYIYIHGVSVCVREREKERKRENLPCHLLEDAMYRSPYAGSYTYDARLV